MEEERNGQGLKREIAGEVVPAYMRELVCQDRGGLALGQGREGWRYKDEGGLAR